MNWSLLLSAFSFIFFAALPGRTTFLMILMAAKRRPWALFWGAVLAFAAQSVISVGMGTLFSSFKPWVIQFSAGVLFLYFAVKFWRESRHAGHLDHEDAGAENSLRATFLIIFAAEWGDVSQVAIASFSARHLERGIVLVSALAALWTIVVVAIVLGTSLAKVIRPSKIQLAAAVGFAVTGSYLIIIAFQAFYV